jgi:hypothetical protein
MKTFHLAATIAASLAFIAVAGDAQAADNKWFSGLTCYLDVNYPSQNTRLLRWNGTLVNDSSSLPLGVVCPLTRDEVSIASASVQVWDYGGGAAGGGQFSCTLVYEFMSGASLFQFSNTNVTPAPNPNLQTIPLTGLTGGTYYWGSCVIPKVVSGWSHLVRWHVSENEG